VFWERTWLAEARKSAEWEHVILPEQQAIDDWATKSEIDRDKELWMMGVSFVRHHPAAYARQRLSELFWLFPVIPVEEFRQAASDRISDSQDTTDQYGASSIREIVFYDTLFEKIRAWSFRLIFLGAVVGAWLCWRRREIGFLLVGTVILWEAMLPLSFGIGRERYRLQIDPMLIILTGITLDAALSRARHAGVVRRLIALRQPAGDPLGSGNFA
jgi:hypothetical protein